MGYSDYETAPLVDHRNGGGGGNHYSKGGGGGGGGGGVMLNRVITIVTLAVLVVISVMFQSRTGILSSQVSQHETKIHSLEETVSSQAEVIRRFNESVSNSDVLKRLQAIEDHLEETQHTLEDELQHTTDAVQAQLADTVNKLDETVNQAEQAIKQDVDAMKKDFQQYVITTQDQFSMENSFMVYQLAGTFTLLSCLISMWHMTAHLRKFNQPVIQRKILAILWMSPIYAITSWFSLVFHSAEGYLAIVKDGYEAYIIYTFLSFCISVLGKGDRGSVVDLLTKRADHLTPPFRLCPCFKRNPYENDRALADAILLQCQAFAMQFVFLRPLTTIATVALTKCNYYGPWADGPHDYRAPQFYVSLIQNLSVFTAFAGLLKFYHAVDKDLAWCRPFAKFLCIKGVVFMTFWQGLALTVMAEATDVGGPNADEWAKSAQNFLICLEMLLFSIAHFYCFPTEEWEDNYRAKQRKANLGETMALGDFVADLKLIMKGKKKARRSIKKEPSEPTVMEHEREDWSEETNSVTSDMTGVTEDDDDEKAIASAIANTLKSSEESEDEVSKEAKQRLMQSLSFDSRDGRGSDDIEAAGESTGLLSNQESSTSESDEILRPSIFTSFGRLGK